MLKRTHEHTLWHHPVTASTTLTVRVSPEVKKRLSRLAGHTRRTSSYLAGEAIADFVDRELAIVEGIKHGLEDMHADRVTPHKSAMRRLRATVQRAGKGKS
jgi:predicted transcriptional regulator